MLYDINIVGSVMVCICFDITYIMSIVIRFMSNLESIY